MAALQRVALPLRIHPAKFFMHDNTRPIRVTRAALAAFGVLVGRRVRPDGAPNWQIRAQVQFMFPK